MGTGKGLAERLLPDRLWARFALLLLVALVCANLIAALLLAREGTALDRTVRIERDMGRLVALVETLEAVDAPTGRAVLERTGTGYTRFSLDPQPLIAGDAPMLGDLVRTIQRQLPGHKVRVVPSTSPAQGHNAMPLMVLSVQLEAGDFSGQWLNTLVYPLTASTAWSWKAGFFIPLAVSLLGSLLVGIWFTRRMTAPLRAIADAAGAAGRGNRLARLPETGALELRNVASAFNEMQQKIADFDSARQQMLAAIGHDLRTPLTGLRLRASLTSDAEMRPDMIRIIDEMAVMSQDLVTYSRSSDSSEAPQSVDLQALLMQLSDELGAKMAAPTAPLMLTLRPVAIRRAIGNLIGNAIRYAGAAEVALAEHPDTVAILVRDRGPGLPEDMLNQVKQPFTRGDSSRSAETGGAGLGLAIVEKIARDHGGTLTLRNRRGGGLEAELILPKCPLQAAGHQVG
ncbi:HAMP domain-containing protein [Xinfangfangia sp. D13-10-4-6]|uniref:ATP-binding protein n=1 Tax=Pseudogemmobacter hezensis TaxID=2737662 RepID=UPI0015547567|nr:ATP-binding protein [Pseudogemmobacter hezensis]NPD16981.1 HAMP domain-containing protein [Pseudogemmobacter hezensis]